MNFIFSLLFINWEILTVDTAFLICLLVGLGYSLLQLFMGGGHGFEMGGGVDLDVGNVDIGIGGHELVDIQDVHIHGGGGADASGGVASPSPFNMMTVSNFSASFGAIGLITRIGFNTSPIVSILITTPISLIIAYALFWFFYRFLFSQQGSSVASYNEFKGLTAEVITPIPADGYGEIAYVLRNSRMTSPAKSLNKKTIGKGELVQIFSMGGSTAYVRIF